MATITHSKNIIILFHFLLVALLFNGCIRSSNSTSFDKEKYIKRGQEITADSFKALSSQLKNALKEGGVPNAIQYCNFMANPIVDSLSNAHNANIRRVSFNARNIGNRPDKFEKEILISFQYMHKNREEIEPFVTKSNEGEVTYYQPIFIPNALCLNCHGDPGTTISTENYELIQSLYPSDEAIGYKEGDLRGMWSVTFE